MRTFAAEAALPLVGPCAPSLSQPFEPPGSEWQPDQTLSPPSPGLSPAFNEGEIKSSYYPQEDLNQHRGMAPLCGLNNKTKVTPFDVKPH